MRIFKDFIAPIAATVLCLASVALVFTVILPRYHEGFVPGHDEGDSTTANRPLLHRYTPTDAEIEAKYGTAIDGKVTQQRADGNVTSASQQHDEGDPQNRPLLHRYTPTDDEIAAK
jgi:hypothetical protein